MLGGGGLVTRTAGPCCPPHPRGLGVCTGQAQGTRPALEGRADDRVPGLPARSNCSPKALVPGRCQLVALDTGQRGGPQRAPRFAVQI